MTDIKSPIYTTGISSNGKLLLGGIFKMQDTFGFPVDSSFEELKSTPYDIDWLEALCDCWLNDCLKFDSFVHQCSSIAKVDLLEMFKIHGAKMVSNNKEILSAINPVDEVCTRTLSIKRNK